MNKPLKLVTSKSTKKTNPLVIERLEQALEFAKLNYADGCFIMLSCDDGREIMDCWAQGSNTYSMLGGLEGLKQDYINIQIEER